MKGLYINSIHSKDDAFYNSGVNKKIISQIKVLNKYFDVELELHNTYEQRNGIFERIFRRLPFTAVSVNWKYKEKYSKYEFIYFRKNILDNTVYKLFRDIKRSNPLCKIILEIPTYPYSSEILMHGLKDYPFYLKDLFCRCKLKKYVDRIVTFSDDDEIFGIKTIKTMNGIDFDNIPERKCLTNNTDIHAISVAYFNNWHGIDRLLFGLGKYYESGGTRQIYVNLVGDGESVPLYKKIVDQYQLQKRVFFYGYLSGKELDEIYDKSNLGISTMGLHRKNCTKDSSLKTREYAAKGLPITGGKTDLWDSSYPFAFVLPDDDSPVNINNLIPFFDNIYCSADAKDIAEQIRKNSQKICDMNITMKPVIDYLLE